MSARLAIVWLTFASLIAGAPLTHTLRPACPASGGRDVSPCWIPDEACCCADAPEPETPEPGRSDVPDGGCKCPPRVAVSATTQVALDERAAIVVDFPQRPARLGTALVSPNGREAALELLKPPRA